MVITTEKRRRKIQVFSRKAYVMNQVYQKKKIPYEKQMAEAYYKRLEPQLKVEYQDKPEQLKVIKKWVEKEIKDIFQNCQEEMKEMIEIANRNAKDYDKIKEQKMSVFLSNYPITSRQVEHKLQQSHLQVTGLAKDSELIENVLMLPQFAVHFYWMIYHNKELPSQEEFKVDYLRHHKRYYDIILPKEELGYLENRICRMYPSLVRDFHFHLIVRESNTFDEQEFTLKHDIEGKMDMLVSKKGKTYGLQLRTATARSNAYYKKKKKRSPWELPILAVDCPFDLTEDAKTIKSMGDELKLYDEKYLNKVKQQINQTVKEFVATVPVDYRSTNEKEEKAIIVFNVMESTERTQENFKKKMEKR